MTSAPSDTSTPPASAAFVPSEALRESAKALAALSASIGSSQEFKPKDAVEFFVPGSDATAPWHKGFVMLSDGENTVTCYSVKTATAYPKISITNVRHRQHPSPAVKRSISDISPAEEPEPSIIPAGNKRVRKPKTKC